MFYLIYIHTNQHCTFFIARTSIYELEIQFGELVKGIKEDLQHDGEKISELSDLIQYKLPLRLKGLRHYITDESVPINNFSTFFRKLECLWDFLDFDLLRCIIIAYKNKELNIKLEEYEANLEKFCTETTIQELIKHWKPRFKESDIPPELKSCVTELKWDPCTSKVKDLMEIQDELRDPIPQELAKAAFYIYKITFSSVKVVWLVWTKFISQIMVSMRKLFHDNPDFVIKKKISCFTLDNIILYSSYNDEVRLITFAFSSQYEVTFQIEKAIIVIIIIVIIITIVIIIIISK